MLRSRDKALHQQGSSGLLTSNVVATNVVTEFRETGEYLGEVEAEYDYSGVGTKLIPDSHLSFFSRMIDENHAPVRPPRKIYTKKQKRELRAKGLWPPNTYRPWVTPVSITDGPCVHTKHTALSAEVAVDFVPRPIQDIMSYWDYPVNHKLRYLNHSGVTGKVRYLPGLTLVDVTQPPVGFNPLAASSDYERVLNNARARALKAVFHDFEGKVDGLLNLLEMKEIPVLAKDLRRLCLKALHALSAKNLYLLQQAISALLRGKSVPNHHLMVKFGIEPLAREIFTLFGRVTEATRSVRRILEQQDIVTVAHAQETLRVNSFGVNRGFASWEFDTRNTFLIFPEWDLDVDSEKDFRGTCSVPYSDDLVPTSLKYNLTVRYIVRLPYPPDIEAILLAFGQMGLDLSLSQIWAHIPFSFIVDWFVPIGSYIADHFDSRLSRVVVEVPSSVESVKYRWKRSLISDVVSCDDFEVIPPSTFIDKWSTESQVTPTALWAGRFYSRQIYDGLPPLPTYAGALPRGWKLASAASLILQKL